MKKKVLLVGWHPSAVDYTKWPGLTPEKLLAGLVGDRDKLNALEYEAELGLIESAETASEVVETFLTNKLYDCVLIGAGVRTDNDCFLLFETLINTVHEHATQAKICFNTGPFDSVDAVKRWI